MSCDHWLKNMLQLIVLVNNIQLKLSYKLDCVKASDGDTWVTASPRITKYQMHETSYMWA